LLGEQSNLLPFKETVQPLWEYSPDCQTTQSAVPADRTENPDIRIPLIVGEDDDDARPVCALYGAPCSKEPQ